MRQKDELLEELNESYYEAQELDVHIFVVTILSMVIILALVFPKIFISANIYYESLEIATLQKDYLNLSEQNEKLKEQISMNKFYSDLRDNEEGI